MDVVYLRCTPSASSSPALKVDLPPSPGETPQGDAPDGVAAAAAPVADAASTAATSSVPSSTASSSSPPSGRKNAPRRTWDVSVQVNGANPVTVTVQDPFAEAEYGSIFERYLHHSDRHRWSAETLAYQDDGGVADLDAAELEIRRYGERLLAQLGLQADNFSEGATECRLMVVEDDASDDANARATLPLGKGPGDQEAQLDPAVGIHCLAWELLEAVRWPRLPSLLLRVTRVCNFPPTRKSSNPVLGHRHGQPHLHPHTRQPSPSPRASPRPLSAVQADPGAAFKVLLVVARDFSRTGSQRDPEPDLAQWPLMNLQKRLRGRLILEVVRPGSKEELEAHLAVRASQGVRFNLVHFDLHGRIKAIDNHGESPCLLFAKGRRASPVGSYQVPQTQLARAEDIARLLARHQVDNVVLNACLSAYNRRGSETNLAHIFLRHGIENVSAMWFYVHSETVSTYVEAFYNELLVRCADFHVAAQRGREAIRKEPTKRTDRDYQDFFICVNYKREESWGGRRVGGEGGSELTREPSPTPSARSQDSTTSTNSIKSFMSGVWKPPTPRLGGEGFGIGLGLALLAGEEPVMRMKLHLLELEYKLMSSRVVYASDLGRAGSDLETTMDKMVGMWLSTNLVDEVCYYKAKDFAKRRLLGDAPSPRDRRGRGSSLSSGSTPSGHGQGHGHGYLQMLFPRPVRALRQTLHVVREADQVVDPGWQVDDEENRRSETRRSAAQDNLQRFAERLHDEGRSYLIFLGRQDAQWWRTHLQHLGGEWWLHVSWSFTLHSRYRRP